MDRVIIATRDSVCMGDDCTAPNEAKLTFDSEEMLSEFMNKVARYVPKMNEVVWSVHCWKRVIGYLIFDISGNYKIELALPDMRVTLLPEKKIYCRYFHQGRFVERRDGETRILFPECDTLLEKVKKNNFGAQSFHGMTLKSAVEKAEKEFSSPY